MIKNGRRAQIVLTKAGRRIEALAGVQEQGSVLTIAFRAGRRDVAGAASAWLDGRPIKVMDVADSAYTSGLVVLTAEWGEGG